MKRIIYLFLLINITFASNTVIENIIQDDNWILNGQNVNLVIHSDFINSDALKSDVINAKIQALNKKIEIISRVGDIKHSILDLNSFQNKYGDCWVLMTGQEVDNSDYKTITGRTHLPNAERKYLRNFGTKTASLAETQGQATGRPNSPFVTSEDGEHRHGFVNLINPNNGGGYDNEGNKDGSSVSYTKYTGNHSHTIVSGGDAETRPSSFTINMFVKINNICNLNSNL